MAGSATKTRILLYGAYGYTGRLTAELAAARKLDIVLAGRNLKALSDLGNHLGLPTREIRLDNPQQLSGALKDIACIVHMAGPFAITSAPMLDACLETKTNYVDVTGEIEVFQAVWLRKGEIERAGITAIPGAGFDVVPTDNLAGYVASKLEQPSSLLVAVSGLQSVSQGTLRTAIRQISKPVLCRRGGTIVVLEDRSPQWIDFGVGAEPCVPISWGDVATAFYSTGIGNITVYFRRTTLFQLADVIAKLFGPVLRGGVGQRVLSAIVRKLPEGPSESDRIANHSKILAEATDSSGRSFRASLSTPDAYNFTAHSALEIASRITAMPTALGLVTPFQAFGADFVLSLPGCSRTDIPSRSTASRAAHRASTHSDVRAARQ